LTEDGRLEQQIRFILEIDKLKQIQRRTWLTDQSRHENDAEHSWHLGVMAILLLEHAGEPNLDLLRVLKMILVHDLVEIDAGDTFVYDEEGAKHKAEREGKAADRIFAMLPADQAAEVRSLWEEFESRRSAEARFAAALDRLQPILHNYHTHGKAWREHGIAAPRVIATNKTMGDGSPLLWDYAQGLIADAVARGFLAERDPQTAT
jgi:putative hydrolase of HD superfamily